MEEYHFRKETLYNSLFHGTGIVPDYRQSLHVQAEKTKGGLITLLVGSAISHRRERASGVPVRATGTGVSAQKLRKSLLVFVRLISCIFIDLLHLLSRDAGQGLTASA